MKINNLSNQLFVFFVMAIIFVVNASSVSADYFVHHKPKVVGQLFINKQVRHPDTGTFVENLSITDPHFLPGQEVVFRVEVKNVGSEDIHDIDVKDVLPDFVNLVSGLSSFDSGSKTLSLRIDKLAPNESKVYEIKTTVKPEGELPSNMVTCITNMAEARFRHVVNQDTAGFCIEKKVLGVTKVLPKTGPSGLEVALGTTMVSSLLALGIAKRLKFKIFFQKLRGGDFMPQDRGFDRRRAIAGLVATTATGLVLASTMDAAVAYGKEPEAAVKAASAAMQATGSMRFEPRGFAWPEPRGGFSEAFKAGIGAVPEGPTEWPTNVEQARETFAIDDLARSVAWKEIPEDYARYGVKGFAVVEPIKGDVPGLFWTTDHGMAEMAWYDKKDGTTFRALAHGFHPSRGHAVRPLIDGCEHPDVKIDEWVNRPDIKARGITRADVAVVGFPKTLTRAF